jgi:DNA polymerase-3 subunit gamma/tau
VRVLDLHGAALEAVRAAADPRTQLELALVKGASPQIDGSTRALLARIERLEQGIAGSAARVAAPPVAFAPAPSAPGSSAPTAPSAHEADTSEEQTPAVVQAPESTTPPQPPSSQPQPMATTNGQAAPESTTPPPPSPQPPSSQPQPTATTNGQAGVSESPEHDGAPTPVPIAAVPAPGDLDALWPAVHESVKAEHGLLGAVLNEAVPTTLTEQELMLAFAPTAAFHKRKAEDPANRAILIETLRRLTGRRYVVSFELHEDLSSDEGAGNGGAPPSEEDVMARLVAELDAEELPEDWLQQQKGGE